MSWEQAKVNAAKAALSEVEGCRVVGVGTGSTVEKFVELLAREGFSRSQLYVPSSIDTALKLSQHGLLVLDPGSAPEVEVYVDGADEVDSKLNMIKGGGAAMTTEKILAHYARKRVFIVDQTKLVDKLGEKHPVPIEVLPCALVAVLRELEKRGFKAAPRYPGRGKAGPVVSDAGGVIVDVYTGPISDPEKLNLMLKSLPGVVETGLFVGYADVVYVGSPEGCKALTKAQL